AWSRRSARPRARTRTAPRRSPSHDWSPPTSGRPSIRAGPTTSSACCAPSSSPPTPPADRRAAAAGSRAGSVGAGAAAGRRRRSAAQTGALQGPLELLLEQGERALVVPAQMLERRECGESRVQQLPLDIARGVGDALARVLAGGADLRGHHLARLLGDLRQPRPGRRLGVAAAVALIDPAAESGHAMGEVCGAHAPSLAQPARASFLTGRPAALASRARLDMVAPAVMIPSMQPVRRPASLRAPQHDTEPPLAPTAPDPVPHRRPA